MICSFSQSSTFTLQLSIRSEGSSIPHSAERRFVEQSVAFIGKRHTVYETGCSEFHNEHCCLCIAVTMLPMLPVRRGAERYGMRGFFSGGCRLGRCRKVRYEKIFFRWLPAMLPGCLYGDVRENER